MYDQVQKFQKTKIHIRRYKTQTQKSQNGERSTLQEN